MNRKDKFLIWFLTQQGRKHFLWFNRLLLAVHILCCYADVCHNWYNFGVSKTVFQLIFQNCSNDLYSVDIYQHSLLLYSEKFQLNLHWLSAEGDSFGSTYAKVLNHLVLLEGRPSGFSRAFSWPYHKLKHWRQSRNDFHMLG